LSAGSSTVLSFQASGDGPFAYQWRFGGSPVQGGTNSMMVLTNVTAAQAGLYDVVVRGAAGTVTSAAASVAVFGIELASSGSGTVPLLALDGVPGTKYRMEFSTELSSTNWTLLSLVTLQHSTFQYLDSPVTNASRRLYRAVPQ
jgi:hypothetical protein